ncbi:hypothetical protein BP5796_04842 [Coleophoma crateriformis]|uniref:Uncharacterized protein n=1 Tax=Coleophoma crateriformis TaxID=565419 RepID=A0A3D8SB23_9HELO|nr:hypothetical protein BP5796_04842 [Coleophoma crateriformis]
MGGSDVAGIRILNLLGHGKVPLPVRRRPRAPHPTGKDPSFSASRRMHCSIADASLAEDDLQLQGRVHDWTGQQTHVGWHGSGKRVTTSCLAGAFPCAGLGCAVEMLLTAAAATTLAEQPIN